MTETVLVKTRGTARSMSSLAMKCDEKEIPEAADGTKPKGWWLGAECTFGGQLKPEGATGTLSDSQTGTMKGRAAVAVFDDRVIGIISPTSETAAAIWWSWPLASVAASAIGTQGVFRKRPEAIRLDRNGGVDHDDGDSIVLRGVARLYRSSRRFQAGQEGSLLEAFER